MLDKLHSKTGVCPIKEGRNITTIFKNDSSFDKTNHLTVIMLS